MISVKIAYWEIVKIIQGEGGAEKHAFLKEHFPKALKKDLADFEKGYESIPEFFINRLEDLPSWLIKHCEINLPQLMKLFKEDGNVDVNNLNHAIHMRQVHLPGNELLKLNEVQVHENACTEMINEKLQNGWRMIAVCPQATRRPDYILGRINIT